MQIKLFPDWPNLVGRKQAFVGSGTGPASYVSGGDPVTLTGYATYIDAISGNSVSVSNNYVLQFQPSIAGLRATWKAKWLYAIGNTVGGTAGNEVTAATNLSSESVVVSGFASGT